MGKKSKRKAAKAAAAAAGTSNTSSICGNGQLILGPRPDGIVCTNEDHKVCAVCQANNVPMGPERLNICCGTINCEDCQTKEMRKCPFCNVRIHSAKLVSSFAKKRAKEGFPWAFYLLADFYRVGYPPHFPQSSSMAFSLYKEAAGKDHPIACVNLASLCVRGIGCSRNLEKARVLFEKAVCLRAEEFVSTSLQMMKVGFELSLALLNSGCKEVALSLLAALAERGNGEAQCFLGELHLHAGDREGSLRWDKVCSENPSNAIFALNSSNEIHNLPLSRHWYGVVSKSASDSFMDYERKLLRDTHETLCDLRQKCAWCNTKLGKSTRKLCKGCKAHCYCGIACQAAHWNADVDCHRDKCQKAMEVKKKTIAMMKK